MLIRKDGLIWQVLSNLPVLTTSFLQEALNAHDRVCKSTDLPLFFGRKDKDTVPPNLLLDRINGAATVAQWNTAKLRSFT